MVRAGPGEGAFSFERVTIGVVLLPLRTHHAAYGSDRRRPLPLMPGQGWIFPAGMDGWCRWDEPNDFLNVTLEEEMLAEAGMTSPAFSPRSGRTDGLVAQLALSLHAAGDDAPRIYRDSLTMALAAQMARITSGPAIVPAGSEPRMDRVLDYIESHLQDDISLEDLAAVAAMSRFHFARVFRQMMGMPPHAYLVARRIERAKDLLAASRLPIAEIAWQVGYANPAKFAAQFRRRTGLTPGAWRMVS